MPLRFFLVLNGADRNISVVMTTYGVESSCLFCTDVTRCVLFTKYTEKSTKTTEPGMIIQCAVVLKVIETNLNNIISTNCNKITTVTKCVSNSTRRTSLLNSVNIIC